MIKCIIKKKTPYVALPSNIGYLIKWQHLGKLLNIQSCTRANFKALDNSFKIIPNLTL